MSRPFVTASAIERVIACPASAVLPQTASTSIYSQRGQNDHSDYEEVVLNQKDVTSTGVTRQEMLLPDEAIPEVAFSYDVVSGDADELGRVSGRDYPKSPFSTIFGTADVVGKGHIIIEKDGRTQQHISIDIMDWKNTYEPPPPDSWQMRILAFMGARARRLSYARTRIVHIRKSKPEHSAWKLWTEKDFEETELHIKRAYDTVNKLGWKKEITLADVRHGPHCHFCPAYLSCPYPRALLQANGCGDSAAIISDMDARNAYMKWQALRTLTGRMEDAVKAFAIQKPVDLGNGYLYGKPGSSSTFRKYKIYDSSEEE